TWDLATRLQAEMFAAVGAIGGLDIQLVHFRGLDEFSAANWVSDHQALTAMMRKITCDAGSTQIEKVLRHARQENAREKIGGLILISDACEEPTYNLHAQPSSARSPV